MVNTWYFVAWWKVTWLGTCWKEASSWVFVRMSLKLNAVCACEIRFHGLFKEYFLIKTIILELEIWQNASSIPF